jgi:hypothetical protein
MSVFYLLEYQETIHGYVAWMMHMLDFNPDIETVSIEFNDPQGRSGQTHVLPYATS